MKQLIRFIIIAISSFFFLSCVNSEYNWDNLDKTGVLNIPPVMFGNIDTIYLEGLSEAIIPEGIPVPDAAITKSDTIKGLFDGDVIEDFFFDGAGNIEISAKADIDVATTGVTIDIYCFPVDYQGKYIEEVKIDKQTLTTGKDINFSITIASEDMKYMENAKDLGLIIVLQSKNAYIWIGEDDYIFIKNVIVKTGGYHIDL